MRRGVLAVVLVGCNQVYGLDPTRVRDLEPPTCATERFSAPRAIAQFEGQPSEFDAQLSGDGKELWFTRSTPEGFGIYRGVRTNVDQDFALSEMPVPLVDRPFQIDPALTADGRRLLFIASGSGGASLFEAVREDPHAFPFDRVLIVAGFGEFSQGVESFDMSWDGLRVYFTVSGGEIYMASRANRDAPFGPATTQFPTDPQMGLGAGFPTVSGDELEIFYNHYSEGPRLYRRAREDVESPWGPEELVLDEGSDPDISPTSSTMLISYGGGLYVLDRPCAQD